MELKPKASLDMDQEKEQDEISCLLFKFEALTTKSEHHWCPHVDRLSLAPSLRLEVLHSLTNRNLGTPRSSSVRRPWCCMTCIVNKGEEVTY
jgi:hypothetical protein